MTQPLVSVCIPAYNAAGFIEETVNSVLAQSYRNIEILVGNNCSTDATGEIVDRLRQKDPRIVHVKHEQNLGYVGNLNRLFGLSRGEFVAFFHADDVYHPTLLEREVAVLQENSAVGAVFCKADYFTTDVSASRHAEQPFLKPGSHMKQGNGYLWGGLEAFLPIFLKRGNCLVCPSFLTRRSSFELAGPWSDSYVGVEDLNLWLRYLKSGLPLAIVTDYLICYREHATSGSSALAAIAPGLQKDSHFRLLDDFLKQQEGVPKRQLISYRKRKAKIMMKVAYAYHRKADSGNFQQYLERSRQAFNFPLWNKRGLMQRFPLQALKAGFKP